MKGTMRAVRKLGAGRGGAVVDVPIPPVGSNEVLVRVEAASICGTDLHIWNWDDWSAARVRPPITLGHEMAGTVVEVGAGMERTAVGDFVSAESHVTCGVCFQCRTGQAHMCPQTSILGVDRDGCFAEYVAIARKGPVAHRPQQAAPRDSHAAGAFRKRRLLRARPPSDRPERRRPGMRSDRPVLDSHSQDLRRLARGRL